MTQPKSKEMDDPILISKSSISNITENSRKASFAAPENVNQEKKYYVLVVEKDSCSISEVGIKHWETMNMKSLLKQSTTRFANTTDAMEKMNEILKDIQNPGVDRSSSRKKELGRIVRYSSKDQDDSSTDSDSSMSSTEDDEKQLNQSAGNVIVGRKRITRSFTGLKGRRTQLNLHENDDEESSSDEDDGNRNILGQEETRPEAPMSITGETPEIKTLNGCKDEFYCHICNKPNNSKKNKEAHENGVKHLSKLKAPSLDRGDIVKTGKPSKKVFTMTTNPPRTYQLKLAEKAISADCVVFLPTGTGKTMVSVLTMGHMLETNPRRPVIFIVDKVLLVFQQKNYIETEFKDAKFLRLNLNVEPNEKVDLVERNVNVVAVCGGDMLVSNNLPIWKHDIIVTTADYCTNMLDNGVIRWEDFSLAVLDEAHHCVKNHPYKRLIKNYHHEKITDPNKRPKILGLTASPAGKSSVAATCEMLQNLLKSLGDANIAIVEEGDLQEMKIYQSCPRLHQFCVSLTDKERRFHKQCIKYFLQCYVKLAPLSNILKNDNKTPCSYFNGALTDSGQENLEKMTDGFIRDPAPLSEMLLWIDHCLIKDAEIESESHNLCVHTKHVLENITDLPTGINFEQLKSVFTDTDSDVLQGVKEFELPCDIFYQQILDFEKEEGSNEPAMIGKLIQILQDPNFINDSNSTALVLVTQRTNAKSLAKKLKRKKFIIDRDLKVTYLVGHGKGDGMSVKKQKKLLGKKKKYNIIVATSIAEEGIDINTLDLVVTMNPPSNVRAFVQMRGRTREKGSNFVILCSNEEEMKRLDELKRHEENMMEAARICIQNERVTEDGAEAQIST